MGQKQKGCGFRIIVGLAVLLLVIAVVAQSKDRILGYFFPLEYQDSVEAYAAAYDLDPYLVFAVIRQESSFKPQAESSVGALGLMQLMPSTAAWIIEHAGFENEITDILEPDSNIRLGCWYLSWLRDYYEGDLIVSLAAYNAGMTNVNKWLAAGTWNGTLERVADIPFAETRKYVRYVWEGYETYTNLYGK